PVLGAEIFEDPSTHHLSKLRVPSRSPGVSEVDPQRSWVFSGVAAQALTASEGDQARAPKQVSTRGRKRLAAVENEKQMRMTDPSRSGGDVFFGSRQVVAGRHVLRTRL